MAEDWGTLPEDAPLKTGDVLRVWSQVVGIQPVVTAAQMDYLGTKIERENPRFRVEGYSLPDESEWFYVKVRVLPPVVGGEVDQSMGLTAGLLLSAFLVAAGVVLGVLMVAKIQRRSLGDVAGDVAGDVVGDVVEKAAWGAAKIAAFAVLGYLAVNWFKGKAAA